MEKITLVLFEHQDAKYNLQSSRIMPALLTKLIAAIQFFEDENGIHLIDFSAQLSAKEFIYQVQKIVPNRERKRGQDWQSSRISDTQILQEQTKDRLYKKHSGKIAGLNVTLEKFHQSVNVPIESARNLIDAIADIDAHLIELPKQQYFWQFISVVNGQVKVDPNAEREILNHFQVYATPRQQDFFYEVQSLLTAINDLETKFSSPGLVSKSLIESQPGRYSFNPQNLKTII